MAGIRVRPSDLARLIGVSKQAVSSWVKDGRVTLGADGRVDPRVAINRLLATGDPSRLRAKFLAPIIGELTEARQRIAALESLLASERENSEFHEGSVTELLSIFDALKFHLELGWGDLIGLDPKHGLEVLKAWIDLAMKRGADPGLTILDLSTRLAGENGGKNEAA